MIRLPAESIRKRFAGRDDGGGAVFGDDGGAGIFLAGLQVVARIDLRVRVSCRRIGLGFWAEEIDAELCSAWTAGRGRPYMLPLRLLTLRRFHNGAEAQGY